MPRPSLRSWVSGLLTCSAVFLQTPERLAAQLVEQVPGCPNRADRSASELLALESGLSARTRDSDSGWTALACIRTTMAARRMIARTGWGMALGDPWRTGALRAAGRALEQSPGDPLATGLFLRLAMDSSQAPQGVAPSLLAEAGEIAFEHASRHDSADPTVLKACTGFALLARDLATARHCIDRALAHGVDSTWHLLRLGWIEAGYGKQQRASESFIQAVAAAGSDDGLHALAAAIPGGVRPNQLDRGRWRTDAPYRDSIVAVALAVGEHAQPDEIERTHAAQLLAVVPTGMSFTRCASLPRGFRSCRQYDPVPRNVRIAAQVVRAWDPEDGWINLVTVAIPVTDLPNDGERHELTIRFRAAGTRLYEQEWRTTYQQLGSTGVLVRLHEAIPEGPITNWTLDASVDDWTRSGRQYGTLDDASDTDGVSASSLVLGSTDQGLAWVAAGDSIPLLPLAATTGMGPVALSLQVINSGIGREAQMHLLVEPFGVGRSRVAPLLTLALPHNVTPGYQLLRREIDVSRLEPGIYTVRVRLQELESVLVERTATLEIQR